MNLTTQSSDRMSDAPGIPLPPPPGPVRRWRPLLAGAAIAMSLATLPLGAQGEDSFANVETLALSNGLKVWLRPFSDEPSVQVTLLVAGGASLDPVGKEELAHFAEHVAFGDRPGMTEAALNRVIESLGGRITANTTADRTMFRVTIPARHAEAAIRWMAQVVTPRPVTRALVEQQRRPIMLELGASPRRLVDWVRAIWIDPPALRRASPWKRDFGITSATDRDYYAYRSLSGMTAADVQGFIDRYYVPGNMTLVVTGGLEPSTVRKAIDGSFGQLARGPRPTVVRSALLGRQRHVTAWGLQRTAIYGRTMRAASLGASDRVTLLLLRDLLEKRLDDRLRFGASKVVYHPSVVLSFLRDAAILSIVAISGRDDAAFVRRQVDDELERLRTGQVPESSFVADRDAIAQRVRLASHGSTGVTDWASSHFFATAPGESIPDVVGIYEQVTPTSLAAFMQARIPATGEGSRLLLPPPVSPALVAMLAVAIVWLVISWCRRTLVCPVDMRRVRYVARLRADVPIAAFLVLVAGLACAVAARLLVSAARPVLEKVVFPLPGPLAQGAAYALALAMAAAILVGIGARIPRKFLVFEDHARLKYLMYRSLVLRPDDLSEVRRLGFREVWLGHRLWRCLALTLGVGTPGLYLKLRDGRAIFCRVRATDELEDAIKGMRAGPSSAAPGPPAR